jgi:signal peptidase I
MEPTLLGKDNVGDRIIVNKFLYRFHPPRRDDVVVFLAPPAAMEGNPDFIKRLIGAPGDVIQAVRGRVVVNGQEYDHMTVRDALGHAGIFGQDAESSTIVDQADHHVKFVKDGVLADGRFIPKAELAQIITQTPNAQVEVYPGYNIRNGKRLNEPFIAEDPDYDLQIYHGEPLKHQYDSDAMRDEYQLGPLPDSPDQPQQISREEYDHDKVSPPEAIPPHEILMMGDNRNDSNDGTNWGLLREKRVVGRAVFIFWPLNRIHPIH